ncbi:MAG: universal stress protein [Thermoproteus sp.]|nr:universal stress protein [Thermoproteus sp.]
MYKKILVGYDGSEHSKKALAHAVELAKAHNASLYMITVAPLASKGGELPASAL